jgi:hypothetical protein
MTVVPAAAVAAAGPAAVEDLYDRLFGPAHGDPVNSSRAGIDLPAHSRIGVPMPDLVPHNPRGYLPPDENAIAALRAAQQEEQSPESEAL